MTDREKSGSYDENVEGREAPSISEAVASDPDWIMPSEARRLLMSKSQNPADIEEMFALYLRHGDLHAKAEAMWKSDERFTADAWRTEPEDTISGPVPQRYWRQEKAIVEDRSQWRISANRFLATTRMKPRRRIMMRGVRFFLPDLQRLQPVFFGSEKVKAKRGRPVETVKRNAAWKAALEYILNQTTGNVEIPSIEALALNLDQLCEGSNKPSDRPSDHQIRPVASAAHEVLRSLGRLSSK